MGHDIYVLGIQHSFLSVVASVGLDFSFYFTKISLIVILVLINSDMVTCQMVLLT